MQLKYEKRRFISKINTQNKSKYVKTAINDNNIFPPNLKKKTDSQNFQLNNDNILFSEERNVKPKNYMVNLRNPNNQAYKKYSNINLSGSFNSMDKKTVEVPDKSYLRNYYISRQRARPENIKKILNNSAPKINRSNIEFMKTNMYGKEENSDLSKLERQHLNSIKISNNVNKKNINDFDNMFSKNISLLKPSKNNYIDNSRKTRYIRKQIQNLYNDEDDNEEGFFNDFENNPLNFNKSVRYENNSDYNIESYTDRYRYNLEKQNNNNYNDKYINNDINYKNINDYNNNSMKYSYGLNQNSQNRYLNNFQISRGWFSIEDEKKGFIGSRFDDNMNKEKNNLENIRQYPGNSFYIKGNKNINSLTISDLNNEFENNSYNNKNLINNQQGEEELNENFELKLKEGFSRIKEEKNIIIKENNKLKEKMNIIDYENQMLRENNYKLNEELKNLKREFSYYNKSQRITNNINKNDTGYYNKNELDNLKEENTKIKNEKYSLLSKAKLMEEQNMKLKEEINNLKKENEIKNNQFNLLNKELSKLNEDINEEFKTSKINLEKLNEDFIALGKENKKFKENLELLEEEKEIELSQKQKLQKENQELKLQQDKLNEQIDFLQEENNELENTGNIQEEYDRLYEEYDNFKKTEMDKYNILLEEKNKLSEELNILKNKGDKNYINNLNKKEVVYLKDSKGTKNNEFNSNEKEENKDVKKLGFLDKIKNAKKSEKEKSKEKKNFNESNNKFH